MSSGLGSQGAGSSPQAQGKGALAIGSMFGPYFIEKELGRGGMGAVYLAQDQRLNRRVALKVILGSDITPTQVKRFMLEAKSMATIRHPNIIEVYEFGDTPESYFTMEFVSGKSLSDMIRNDNLKPKQIAELIKQGAEALAEVHKKGIIHRDIKPSNIMVTEDFQSKLMDFGLAKIVESDLSKSGELLGTPAYMSPEQTDGKKVDARSDIYSLGAALYEGLTKSPPFQGETYFNILFQIMNKDPVEPTQINPDIPVDLEAICLKCLDKNPRKRYINARQLAKDLDSFIQNRPIIAKPATSWTHFQKWIARNKITALLTMFASLSLILALVLAVINNNQLRQQRQQLKVANKQIKQERDEANIQKQRAEDAEIAAKEAEIAAKEAKLKAEFENEKSVAKLYQNKMTMARQYYYNRPEPVANIRNSIDSLPEKDRNNWEVQWLLSSIELHFAKMDIQHASDFKVLTTSEEMLRSLRNHGGISIENSFIPSTYHGHTHQDREYKYVDYDEQSRKQVFLYSRKSQRYLQFSSKKIPYPLRGTSCHFHPQNKRLVLCSYIGPDYPQSPMDNLVLWDVKTGKIVWSTTTHPNMESEKKEKEDSEKELNDAYYANFSHDGRLIAVAGGDGSIKIWRQMPKYQYKLFHEKKIHLGKVNYCAFHPSKRHIVASASSDSNAAIWNMSEGNGRLGDGVVSRFLHQGEVNSCNFSSSGRWLVTASRDHLVTVWDIEEERKIKTLIGHNGNVLGAVFAPNSKNGRNPNDQDLIISTQDGGSTLFWDWRRNLYPEIIDNKSTEILHLEFVPNSNIFASLRRDSNTIEYFNAKTGKLVKQVAYFDQGHGRLFAFDSQGDKIAIAIKKPAQIKVYNRKTEELMYDLDASGAGRMYRCIFTPDGKKVIGSGEDDKFFLWELPSNSSPSKLVPKSITFTKASAGDPNVRCLLTTSDGKFVFAVSEKDMIIRCWDARVPRRHEEREPKYTLECSTTKLDLLWADISKNDRYLIAGSDEGNIYLWDLESKTKLAEYKAHNDDIYQCQFFANDTRIVSTGRDKTIKIWDAEYWRIYPESLRTLPIKVSEPVMVLDGHRNWVRSLGVHSSGQAFVSGGANSNILIWKHKNSFPQVNQTKR